MQTSHKCGRRVAINIDPTGIACEYPPHGLLVSFLRRRPDFIFNHMSLVRCLARRLLVSCTRENNLQSRIRKTVNITEVRTRNYKRREYG